MAVVAEARKARIHWLAWGQEAFERARSEDKLIILDSGATWCHWCHVMDHVTYDDEDVARLINERFIPVRIDRDRLSEVDAYYQRTPAIVDSRAGGWPLTVIITPEGYTLMKATFLPPRASDEFAVDVGLLDLLGRLDDYWRANRQQIEQAGRQLQEEQARSDKILLGKAAKPAESIIDDVLSELKLHFDYSHGGFGTAPKFFNTAALDLLLRCSWMGDATAMEMLDKTLQSTSRGGVYDHVGGGFHRYSVDERWLVPHFEKMGYDNAAMLALYANSSSLTGNQAYARVARETFAWIRQTLLEPNHRGFYASQDADVGPNDDGDYFTWTIQEARQALGSDADLAIYYFGLDLGGDMHGRPGRNVLHASKTIAQAARLLGKDQHELAQQIDRIKAALLAARNARPAPAVDKTIFADINGMMIDAVLTLHERLGIDEARQIALDVADALLDDLRDAKGIFAHYSDAGQLEGIGQLSDQAWMLRALVHAFCVAGTQRYLDATIILADYINDHLTAEDGSPISAPQVQFDTPVEIMPMRPWEDMPTRSSSAIAAEGLLDVGRLTGMGGYGEAARRAISSFAGSVRKEWAVVLGGYCLAVDHLLYGPRLLATVGNLNDVIPAALAEAARRAYIPASIIIAIDPADAQQRLLAEALGLSPEQANLTHVCHARTCLAPARSINELRRRIEELANI